MMKRFLMSTLAMFTLAIGTSIALPAHAQVTDQTDQSEEDWRRSRKKSGTSDIFTPNTRSRGTGAPIIDYEPISEVERLSPESRRHLMRERAKAIAESPDGDISDAEYVPSDEARTDEALARQEQRAWEEMIGGGEGQTDQAQAGAGQGSQGQGQSPQGQAQGNQTNNGSDAPGQGTGVSGSQGPRGGSARSLQEIMDSIRNGGSGSGSAQADGQAGNQGQGQGQSDGQGDATQIAEAGGGASDGQGVGGGSGQAGDQGGGSQGAADGNGGQAGDNGAASSASVDLSPLERIRRAREDRPADGNQRSASDYLGSGGDD